MQNKPALKLTIGLMALSVAASISIAQSPPLFTADYYLSNPEKYLGQNVTLSVAYVRPRNERREDGLQQLEAYTYSQSDKRGGGWISVLTDDAHHLTTVCGTQLQDNSVYGVRIYLLHGVFSAEEKAEGRYYILVQ